MSDSETFPQPFSIEVADWSGQANQLTTDVRGRVATVTFCAGRGEPVYTVAADVPAFLSWLERLYLEIKA